VARPHESGIANKEEIERSIDKKRHRVAMDALHKAEKAKAQTNMFGVVSINRKGAIPNTKLRGINEADFFQKNNSVEKGFTFNYDGTIVDFKKPKLTRNLEEKLDYEVPNHYQVTHNPNKTAKTHNKKSSDPKMIMTDYTGDTMKSDKHPTDKFRRQKTQMEKTSTNEMMTTEYETAMSFQMMTTKQAVIEFKNVAPSKVMTIEKGVELIEKGRSVKGLDYSVDGKLRLE